MKPQESPDQTDYSKPVAYDSQGRPLYARPPEGAPAQKTEDEPQRVYISRPLDMKNTPLPPEIIQRCEESKRLYPDINLSYGEYVISAVKRHPIGLIQIWLFVFLLIFVFGAFTVLFLNGGDSNSFFGSLGDSETLQSVGLALMIIVTVLGVLGGWAATYIYSNNKFFLTNESVIQEIQTTLFSHHEQTVSLINIEDASYEQRGILPYLLNYGRIRLSTEGDETTYRFNYVANPKQHIAQLNNAVEAFKNGRSVVND